MPITVEAALTDLASGSAKGRAAAAHALGDSADPRSGPALQRALKDDRAEVRCEAAASLGALGFSPSTPDLLAAASDPDSTVRQAAIIALGTVAQDSDTFTAVSALAMTGTPDVRYQALVTLAEMNPEAAYPFAIDALQDDDREIVSAAISAVASIGDKAAIPALVATMERKPETQFEIALALAELGDEQSVALLDKLPLADATRDPWLVLDALAKLPGRAAIHAMEKFLPDRGRISPTGAYAASLLAERLHGTSQSPDILARCLQLLTKGSKSYHVHVREICFEALETHDETWSRPTLERLASSWRPSIRKRAITALQALTHGPDPDRRARGTAQQGIELD